MEKINLSVELRHCPKVDAQVDAQEYEQYWTSDEGLTSELRFHNKLYYLVNTIIASYHHNDLNAAAKDISRLLWADDYIESEPLLSIYESGLVTVFLYIIHACANRYKFEEGYAISERSRNLLLAKRERRRELNLPFRPDSECWYRLFDAVAALKWRGSAKWRNHLYTPEELIDNYLPVEQRCLDYI